jgi:hypothetical protein
VFFFIVGRELGVPANENMLGKNPKENGNDMTLASVMESFQLLVSMVLSAAVCCLFSNCELLNG